MKYWAIILAMMLTLLSGCLSSNEFMEALLDCQDISLTWKGQVQVSYDPDSFQLGHNNSRHEYRVYDDRLAYWFIVSCSEQPTHEGQTVKADVSWTGINRTHESKGCTLIVKKVDSSGKIWLWNQEESIGIVVKNQ